MLGGWGRGSLELWIKTHQNCYRQRTSAQCPSVDVLVTVCTTSHVTHRLKPNRRVKRCRPQVPFNGGRRGLWHLRGCFIKEPWTFPECAKKHWSQDENWPTDSNRNDGKRASGRFQLLSVEEGQYDFNSVFLLFSFSNANMEFCVCSDDPRYQPCDRKVLFLFKIKPNKTHVTTRRFLLCSGPQPFLAPRSGLM